MDEATPIRLEGGDHVVHFYDRDQTLAETVGAYLAASVQDGDAVIAIATAEHRSAFESALVGAGVDVDGAAADGRLSMLDAAATLAGFMVGGSPQEEAFDRTVGSLVRRAGASGRPVRLYGEMVALLWAEGRVTGAVEVERLWNGLAGRTPFGLLCAYPLSLLGGADEDAFGEICRAHSGVVHGAPVPPEAETFRRFVPHVRAPGQARRYVTDTLAGWDHSDLCDDAALAVGELAANAVRHAGGDFTVGLARHGGGIRLWVGDASGTAPLPRDDKGLDTDGRGLRMIDVLASSWGYSQSEAGKVLWVDLAPQAEAVEQR